MVAVFLCLVLVASSERTIKQKAQIETRNSILKLYCDWTLEEAAQWGCEISSLGDAEICLDMILSNLLQLIQIWAEWIGLDSLPKCF